MGELVLGQSGETGKPSIAGALGEFASCETPMLFSAQTPQSLRDYTCVEGGGEQSANPNTVSFFVNGVLNAEPDSRRSALLLSKKLGRPVVRVHNNSETFEVPFALGGYFSRIKLAIPDFAHAAIAKVAPSLGSIVEPSVNFLRSSLAKVLRRDPSVIVDIHAHSQGGIIVRDALQELRVGEFRGLSEAKWKELSSRIHVTTYGSAEHNFGLPAVEFSHSLDLVPLGTSFVDWVRRRIVDERAPVGRQEVLDVGHSFVGYLDDIPKFLAQELLDKPDIKPAELAQRILALLESERYAPEVLVAAYREVLGCINSQVRMEVQRVVSERTLVAQG